MAEMMAGIIICPKCGQAEIFHDEEKRQQKAAQLCWNCRKQISFPISMTCGKIRLFFDSDLKLYSHHIRGDYDMTTVVGRVVQNPNNPSLSGLRNETGECWTYIRRDGKQVPVPPEKSAAIIAGAKIDFGTCVGIFED